MGVRILKPVEVIRILEANGWRLTRQNGTSHKVYKKAGYKKLATVPDHPKDVSQGVIRKLYEATGLDEFLR